MLVSRTWHWKSWKSRKKIHFYNRSAKFWIFVPLCAFFSWGLKEVVNVIWLPIQLHQSACNLGEISLKLWLKKTLSWHYSLGNFRMLYFEIISISEVYVIVFLQLDFRNFHFVRKDFLKSYFRNCVETMKEMVLIRTFPWDLSYFSLYLLLIFNKVLCEVVEIYIQNFSLNGSWNLTTVTRKLLVLWKWVSSSPHDFAIC